MPVDKLHSDTEHCSQCRLRAQADREVEDMQRRVREGSSYPRIAKEMGVSKAAIYNRLNRYYARHPEKAPK